MNFFEISQEPINTQSVIEKVVQREAGAITTFIGTVRELTHGKKTFYLIYEAYEPMAVKKLEQIGNEIKGEWSGSEVAITHRVGKLDITDIAVVIAVSTPHRADSYEANRYAIERIKEIVPIWKKEHWEDGQEWIGNQLEKVAYPKGKPEGSDLMNKVLFFAHLRDAVDEEVSKWRQKGKQLLNSSGRFQKSYDIQKLDTLW